MNLLKTIALAATAFAIAAVPAFTAPVRAGQIPASVTPAGKWETASGESRYDIRFCGDGTQICATLTWLREDARTPENMAYLNKQVVTGAKKTAPVKWEGKVIYQGASYSGSVTMLGTNKMKMYGCKGPACESMVFNRM